MKFERESIEPLPKNKRRIRRALRTGGRVLAVAGALAAVGGTGAAATEGLVHPAKTQDGYINRVNTEINVAAAGGLAAMVGFTVFELAGRKNDSDASVHLPKASPIA